MTSLKLGVWLSTTCLPAYMACTCVRKRSRFEIADAEEILAERSAGQLSISEVAEYVDELRSLLQDSELAQRRSLVK